MADNIRQYILERKGRVLINLAKFTVDDALRVAMLKQQKQKEKKKKAKSEKR